MLKIFKAIFKYTKFEKIIINHNIDLVYFLSPSNFAQDLDETNFIITVWDLNHRYNNEFPEIRNTSFIEFLERFYSKTLKKASSIIVDSEMSKKDINKYYSIDEERIHVIPFQPSIAVTNKEAKLDYIDIKKKYNLDLPYIFYPAQFWSHKNHVYILEGLKILEQTHGKKIGAIFSGSNQGNFPHVQNEVKRLGLEDRVRFAGFVKDKKITTLSSVNCFGNANFFGPTNIPPLEAFNLGIPVLYSDLPGLREQVDDAALLMDLKNPLTMADHLNNLIVSEEFRNKLIKSGYERSNYFNKIDRYNLLKSAVNQFQIKKACWDNSSKNLDDLIFVVDTPFSAIMVNNIIEKENILNPKVVIEIKQGIHRYDGFEKSIKDLLSLHNVSYEKIVTVPSPYYVYIKKDGLLNKIKKLINWKKVILQTYKPKKC